MINAAMLCLLLLLSAVARPLCASERAESQLQRDIYVAAGETAREHLVVLGGVIRIDGTAQRDVIAIGGSVEINGTAAGNVVCIGASLSLGPSAHVQRDAICIGPKPLRAEGSRVDGQFVFIATPKELHEEILSSFPINPFDYKWSPLIIGLKLVVLFCWFLIGAVVTLAFPVQVRYAADEIKTHWLRFFLTGFIWILACIVVAVVFGLLCVILIGIPLLLLLIVFAVMIKVFGNVAVYYLLGTRVLKALKWGGTPDVTAVLAGLALLGLLSFMPVVGTIVWTAIGILGMGAALSTKFGTGQPWVSGTSRRSPAE